MAIQLVNDSENYIYSRPPDFHKTDALTFLLCSSSWKELKKTRVSQSKEKY